MEPVFDFGFEVTRWLQATYPQLESFFHFISALGREAFYLAMLPLVYWCVDKRLGRHLAYVFLMAHGVNALGKSSLRGPRPYWLDSSVGLGTETSYGVPSGHMESATAFYGLLAGWLKRGWMTTLALFMIIAMGLSRIYLGVHFVHDVLAGWLVGMAVLIGYWLWQRYREDRFAKSILGRRLLMAFLVPLGLAFVYALIRLVIGAPNTAVSWHTFIPGAELDGLEATATAVGALLGLGIGVNFEQSWLRFRVDGPMWQRVVRYLLGMVVTVALWKGLKQIFPADPLWLAVPLRVLRYLVTLLWVGYFAPLVFVRLHLAEADPDPGIQMTI